MSTPKEWLDKYYPISAGLVSKEDALAHSIQKWEGLDKVTLDAHGLYQLGDDILSDNGAVVSVNSEYCALCVHSPSDCHGCVLFHSRGDVPCYEAADDEFVSPYKEYLRTGDNKPMLEALKNCLPKETADGDN